MLRRRAWQHVRRRLGLHGRTSYAQCGEDLILRHVFDSLGIANPTYLDIGANDPVRFSNTYFFYRQGARGMCVEPDPRLAARLRRARPRDQVLNIGVAAEAGTLDFHIMSEPVLNTFDPAEARRLETMGYRIESVQPIRVEPVEQVLAQFGATPDFINIDVEGLDTVVVSAIDFARWRPVAFCVETLTFSETGSGTKVPEIFTVMENHGFFPYADTHINTLFVDEARWRSRG
jgi:FkbM family methyltransferase